MNTGIYLNYNEIVENQLKKCGSTGCIHGYRQFREDINNLLEKYKMHLPIVFVFDMPELGNIYGEIINHECMGLLCLDCCFLIVQFYGLTENNLLTKISHKNKKSLCYN
jgi:hypothetical protein